MNSNTKNINVESELKEQLLYAMLYSYYLDIKC
jgi:hypothetical protein